MRRRRGSGERGRTKFTWCCLHKGIEEFHLLMTNLHSQETQILIKESAARKGSLPSRGG